MPHLRARFALERLEKKLRFSRVVSIQGARQTGKSVLARELFGSGLYVTFDKNSIKEEAQDRIGVFLESLKEKAGGRTIVIDEAQKVPALFDEIKAVVDEDPTPGQFLLLGSTEFSIEAKIQESLTGRISRTRLYPLTLTETLNQSRQSSLDNFWKQTTPTFQRKDLLRYLDYGGLPGVFSIRNRSEVAQKLQEWLKLTCERDVLQVKRLKPDPDLCFLIMETLAHLEEPSATELARRLRVSTKRIQTQLKALSQIFALHRLDPHHLGTGKSLYYLVDSGLGHLLQASFLSKLTIAIITECFAKESYQAVAPCRFSYFRNTKGSTIPLLIELGPKQIIAVKWSDREKMDLRELAILKSFSEKTAAHGIKTELVFLCGVTHKTRAEGVTILPWEMVF